MYKKNQKELNLITKGIKKGLPQNFGIFYALGLALMFIGTLSFCYHVCPTNENFQFDTTFMYVVAILMMIKIYQFRHPMASANAYKVFFGIALVLLLEAIGVHRGKSIVYWIIVALVYFIVMLRMGPILYTSGKWGRPWQDYNLESFVSL